MVYYPRVWQICSVCLKATKMAQESRTDQVQKLEFLDTLSLLELHAFA